MSAALITAAELRGPAVEPAVVVVGPVDVAAAPGGRSIAAALRNEVRSRT